MATSRPRLSEVFLRSASPLAKLAALISLLQKATHTFASPAPATWAQIERGLAADLWISVDSRTDQQILRGEHELPLQKALSRHLRPGMTFYDIGANFGFFSLIAARLVGSEGHVVSFEPDPAVFLRLRQNLFHNGFRYAIVESKAVWCESTTVPFVRASANDDAPGHISIPPSNSSNLLCVESVSLDDYASRHPAPDLIKCDAQGAEVAVFQGASQTLRQWHPTIICKIHDSQAHYALTSYFLDFGYTCYALTPTHLFAIVE